MMFERSYRLAARWKAAVMTAFLVFATWQVASEGRRQVVAGAPLFAVYVYGLALLWGNRVRVRVDAAGARVEIGPVPSAPRTEPVPAAEVAAVYVRRAAMPTRSGAVPYLAAGVQRNDGRWLDLTEPLIADERVWAEAREIAAVLGKSVTEGWARAPKPDWRQSRVAWYWTGAVLAGIGWGCFVELALRR